MDVKDALIELAEVVKRILENRIMEYGVNTKVPKNTLVDSDMKKGMKVTTTEDGIALYIADYWEYIAKGRKNMPEKLNKEGKWVPGKGKHGSTSKLVQGLIEWVDKKNISIGGYTGNKAVWIAYRSIVEKGIKARSFMIYDKEGDLTKMIPELNGYIDKWFDELFDAIMNKIDNFFK